MVHKRCVLGKCNRLGLYHMGWEEDGIKRSGTVCPTHDRYIGRRNLAKWKPWMKQQEIVDWDNQFCRSPTWKDLGSYVFSIDPGWAIRL